MHTLHQFAIYQFKIYHSTLRLFEHNVWIGLANEHKDNMLKYVVLTNFISFLYKYNKHYANPALILNNQKLH